jgi:hypothetical protein
LWQAERRQEIANSDTKALAERALVLDMRRAYLIRSGKPK